MVNPHGLIQRLQLSILALGTLVLVVTGFADLARAQNQPDVRVASIDGAITPVVARYVDRAIDDVEDDGAAALVLEIDTPGGLGSAMDDIVADILASEVPVIVYVEPRGARSASAGVFITYAAHVAAMAPGTSIGSASPVFVGSDGSVGDGSETLARKATNDAVTQIRNLADLRGRNADWAEAAVRDAANISSETALQTGVIDLIAPDLETLLAQVDGRTVTTATGTATLATAGAEVGRFDMNPVEQLLQTLADPTLAYLLVSFGLLGLYVELANPGIGVPGIAGGLALILGLLGLGSLPVEWAGLALIGLAFVLFFVDLFVPSLGILTVGGLVSFVIGSNLLVDDGLPEGLRISSSAISAMTVSFALFSAMLGLLALRSQLRRPKTGAGTLLGQIGEVRVALDPRGIVFLDGERWTARTEGEPIPVGTAVLVTVVDGITLTVRPATATELDRLALSSEPIDRRYVVPPRRTPAAKGV